METVLLSLAYLAAAVLFILSLRGLSSQETARRGNLYGIEKNARQVGPWAYPAKTEIGGLLMCGASTRSFGVSGATKTGLDAAKAILKCKTSDLMTQNGPPLEIIEVES